MPSLPLLCLSFHLCQMEAGKTLPASLPLDPTPALSCLLCDLAPASMPLRLLSLSEKMEPILHICLS